MSAQAPQVLARRPNGVNPAPASQANEGGRGSKAKSAHDHGGSGRSAKSRSTNTRGGDSGKKNAGEGENAKPARTKAHHEGEKLVIRRLPPGMTQQEFVTILGPDWETGKGKVDWFSFSAGKISTDPSKPSRPGRAYLHVMKKDDLMAIGDAVRISKWEDAKSTFNSPSLIGPPAVEFAIYKKVPSNKKRTDARQGTIDQDPEFMAFLEDLANPTPPKESHDADDGDEATKSEVKVTTTPLIEYLKEKKANKGKDGSGSKSAKGDSRKGKSSSKDEDSGKKKGKDSKSDKAEKAPKETVKILTKKSANEQAADASKAPAKEAGSAAQDAPKSRRAGIAAAARILQRDLGLSPGSAHRKARQDAAKADADPPKTSSTKEPTPAPAAERPASPAKSEAPTSSQKNRTPPANAPKSQTSSRRGRGGKNAEKNKSTDAGAGGQPAATATTPVVLLKKKGGEGEAPQAATATPEPQAPAENTNTNTTTNTKSNSPTQGGGPKATKNASQKKAATVTAGATRGFVKHANPSQGITEALLKEALEIHGTITFVEIDKRKGFAYVDFAEHEGLVKAVSASPVTVAQGTVQVLERKDKKPANAAQAPGAAASGTSAPEKSSGRGRRGRGGGGKGNATANSQAAASGNSASASTNTGG